MIDRIAGLLDLERRGLEALQHPFLLVVRLYWGYAFATNGWGKLMRIDEIARWFGEDLGIPMPLLNAYMAASTELVGGILLALGLAGRIATIPLVVTMCVAYLTSDFGGLMSLWMSAEECSRHPECVPFEDAAPFSFLMAASITLLFGPGVFSLDEAIRRFLVPRLTGAPAPAAGRTP
jgi:putative oxidoreductase